MENIEADRNPGIGYLVFLNLPAEDLDEADERAHYVGTVSFFGVEHVTDSPATTTARSVSGTCST